MDWMKKSKEDILEMTVQEVFINLAMYYQHSEAMEAERKKAEREAQQKASTKSKS